MALDKATLKTDLQTIFENVAKKADGTFPTAAEKAQAIADAVDKYVKTASVNVTVNASVPTTTTTCGAGPGTTSPTTATQTISNGSLS